MPRLDKDRAVQFLRRAEGLFERGDVRLNEVRALVDEDPEAAVLAAQAFLGAGGRRNLQKASALAAAYELELEDDSLSLLVERRLAELGEDDAVPRFVATGDPEDRAPILRLDVSEAMLRDADPYPLLRDLSPDLVAPDGLPRLRSLRERCVLGFPSLNDDPREVWEVPEAQRLLRRVHEEMPYFPYYLEPTPALGATFLYFACLVPDAVDGHQLSFSHQEVQRELILVLAALVRLGLRLDDDVEEIVARLLRVFPPEAASELLALADEVL